VLALVFTGVSSTSTPATVALTRASVWYRVAEYHHDSSVVNYGIEAAQGLGVASARVHKTLIATLEGVGLMSELMVAVVPVDAQLDLKALAVAVGAKRADLASVAAAERSSGYVVGGISPVGQRKQLRTVIDEDAMLFDTIYVSGGRRGLDIELAADDLVLVTGGTYAPIAKR
jgi:Cys-tRNA(Pro)/Cys-tRNA(Cys) deacylase